MQLDRRKGAPPLYVQLEDRIRSAIESGQYGEDAVLPTENQYMEDYSVSRVTVRQALTALEQSGYIVRKRGIGTKVLRQKISENIKQVISFTDEMKKHNITMQTSYCTIKKIHPDNKVASELGILQSDFCYELVRVRNVEDKPLVYTITYLRAVAQLPLDSDRYTNSLYKLLHDEYGIVIARGTDVLEAALPDKDVQEKLQIKRNRPIFIRTRKTYMPDDEVIEYSICYYPGDRYKYSVDI